MPTLRRRSRKSLREAATSMPSTKMLPLSKVSSPLMQRSRVLLPEPDLPMMATTAPRVISIETPFRTWTAPKLLRRSRMLTSDIVGPFEPMGEPRQREAQCKIDRRDQRVDKERPEGRVVQHGAGFGEVDEADDRGERRAFNDLHGEADGRRNRDPECLRQDHVPHLVDIAHGERVGRFPLSLRNGVDAA